MQGLNVDIEMCFVETGTPDVRTVELFYLTYYDFDIGKGSELC